MSVKNRELYSGPPNLFRPGRDKYLSPKVLEVLPYFYGRRGQLLVDFYTYIRWFDDVADSDSYSLNTRLGFIEREKRLIQGLEIDLPHLPIENFFNQTSLNVSGNEAPIREQYLTVAESIHDDVKHFGLIPRTREQIKINNIKTILPYAEVISLALNGHSIGATPNFIDLLDSWNYLGSLLHLPKDINSDRIIKVGFTELEVDQIRQLETEDERRIAIIEVFDKDRFQREWTTTLQDFTKNCSAFSELDIPDIQKTISFLYLRLREPLRLPKLFRQIESTLYT